MVMVWLEGGQGEVRGACAPPPPNTPNRPTWTPPPANCPTYPPPPQLTLPKHPPPKPFLDPPPIRPSLNAPPPIPPPPPPRGLRPTVSWGGVVGVQNRGVLPPPGLFDKFRFSSHDNFSDVTAGAGQSQKCSGGVPGVTKQQPDQNLTPAACRMCKLVITFRVVSLCTGERLPQTKCLSDKNALTTPIGTNWTSDRTPSAVTSWTPVPQDGSQGKKTKERFHCTCPRTLHRTGSQASQQQRLLNEMRSCLMLTPCQPARTPWATAPFLHWPLN